MPLGLYFTASTDGSAVGLWKVQADGSVPDQQAAEQPLAQAAVAVVEDPPALLARLPVGARARAEFAC